MTLHFSVPINLVVEGPTDEAVVQRILQHVGFHSVLVRPHSGKHYLLERLEKFNQAAKYLNWLVVTDLDQDADCAPDFVQMKLPNPSAGMLFRITVHEIEAWIMADREQFAEFLNIAIQNIPQNPDTEIDPKITLMSLVRRSRKTSLREDIVPRPKSGRSVGPGYVTRMKEFMQVWRPEVAAQNSDSLRRCIRALENWKMVGA